MSNAAIITDVGLAKIAEFTDTGTPVTITHIAVGDGTHTPDGSETALLHEQWRGAVSDSGLVPPSKRWFEVDIPANVGGFWVREYGLYDSEGDLIAIGSLDGFYKTATPTALAMTVKFRVVIAVTNLDSINVELVSGDVLTFVDSTQYITVGSGGDFAKLSNALEYLRTRYPLYVNGGFSVDVMLLENYVLDEQVLAKDVNLSWIRIMTWDSPTPVARNKIVEGLEGAIPVFGAHGPRAAIPTIAGLFEMDTSGSATNRVGVFLGNGATGYIYQDGGVRNVTGDGILASRGSTLISYRADFSGATRDAVSADNSRVIVEEADLSGAGRYAINAADLALVNAKSADLSDSTSGAVNVGNGAIVLTNGATGAGQNIYLGWS